VKKKAINLHVSFDGLRRMATRAYNKIVEELNESESLADWEKENLEDHFEDLRTALVVLNATSIDEIEHFHEVDMEFVDFNPQNNEE